MITKKFHLRFWPFILSFLVFLPTISIITFSFITTPNTYILDHDFSLLTKGQVKAKLNRISLPDSIQIKHDNLTDCLFQTASVSARIDTDSTADRLFNLPFRHKILFTKTNNYFLRITVDDHNFDIFIEHLRDKVDHPFVPSEITLSDSGQIDISPGSLGLSLDQNKLKQNIFFQLSNLDHNPIMISLDTVGFLPNQEQMGKLLFQAEVLKTKHISLITFDSPAFVVDSHTLISWLDFRHSHDLAKLDQFIDDLNQSLRLEPQNAVFEFENNQVKQFKPAQKGRFISKQELSGQLVSHLDLLLQTDSQTASIDLPFQYIDPIIRNQDVNNLGIKELLGQGQSTFTHSSAIRNKNIVRGAEVINRILVAPDEIFSFNQNLGEVTLNNGYHMAYIIRQGRTELDVGGGICQISTTLFRAALNSGLEIIERRPHAYRVSYYEEDSDPGFDATVFLPKPDLRFKNDTGHHILIQSIYDGTKKSLVYQIYGTHDGRKVIIDNYKKWGYTQPPPDKYIDDPTLPAGKLIQEEHRIAGLKTAFDWQVTRGDQVLHQKTFSSSYAPWPAVYRRGTGN